MDKPEILQSFCVTAQQMQAIEAQIFAAGFPVAALMEKVAGRIADYWLKDWPQSQNVIVLAGPGHNGGDALVVARELHLHGYNVSIYSPFEGYKPLTADHGRYCRSLGIPWYQTWTELATPLGSLACDRILDGLFGFGLSRPLEGELAKVIDRLNQSPIPIVSIDLPSGIHTDSGEALGTAIRAETTLCLGLWKRACLQEAAQPYLGHPVLIDFDIPLTNIEAVLGLEPDVQRLTPEKALPTLPLKRPPLAHKYTVGQLLVIAGSRQYGGAALLSGHGAMASGVGMVTLVVPASLRSLAIAQLPGALVIGAEETAAGAIATLPPLDWDRYHTIACGPGLAQVSWLTAVLNSPVPLLLDADGLNGITAAQLTNRQGITVITPHPGEFRRLFPDLISGHDGAIMAAQTTGATVVLKGAKVAIANNHQLWLNPHSTPALARGGSGDVLTGLMGGVMAQQVAQQGLTNLATVVTDAAMGAVWWHALAGLYAHKQRTILGVDPLELAHCLNPALADYLANGIMPEIIAG
ncbi:yjef-like protein [Leptolyngbya sp. Heron Island J]|uniref:bifunctional ADP-dependent NAD(P)H-hydrate dehydratase/NAD(P)H-hydrate epimerase n=1 Tax=Leptolyngbya sp. Heron Island J TaxID=1385935 RepID=UPI0003B9CF1D|nr:bifunctional ADP-dependent NAD(P)H-hydrate dehydratase/NAD(P)H-hydrate epimerase [Leptolyngbya sp. Heron Island J]ESA36607.1 yjef-like protein [Leptolyngbya sp. Heron Island J]